MTDVRFRILSPFGEIRVVGDSALPFFPGWGIVEILLGEAAFGMRPFGTSPFGAPAP